MNPMDTHGKTKTQRRHHFHVERRVGRRPNSFYLPAPESSAETCQAGREVMVPFPSPGRGLTLLISLPPQPRVTFHKESPVPEESWRLRPYLGYDWIAGMACSILPSSGLCSGVTPSERPPRRSCPGQLASLSLLLYYLAGVTI